MYLIPVPVLTDNDLCLLHDGKHVLGVHPINAGLVMAARNGHGPDSKSILVTHHHGGYQTSIPRETGRTSGVRTASRYVAGVRERRPTFTSRVRVNPIITPSQPCAVSILWPAPHEAH